MADLNESEFVRDHPDEPDLFLQGDVAPSTN